MTYHYQTMTGAGLNVAEFVACPNCAHQLTFHRSTHPDIDACGFESYSFVCRECGAALAGIIDPADETLLLSEAIA